MINHQYLIDLFLIGRVNLLTMSKEIKKIRCWQYLWLL